MSEKVKKELMDVIEALDSQKEPKNTIPHDITNKGKVNREIRQNYNVSGHCFSCDQPIIESAGVNS